MLSSTNPISDQHQASGAPSAAESGYSSPVSAPHPDDGLSSQDRKRRQALEYEEEEEPNALIEHRLEASVSIPNIPLPKSSGGQVCSWHPRAHDPHSPLFPFHSIGLFVCPISSRWTPNHFTQTLTLDPNMKTTSRAAHMNATWVLNSVWRTQSGGVGLRIRMTKRSVPFVTPFFTLVQGS